MVKSYTVRLVAGQALSIDKPGLSRMLSSAVYLSAVKKFVHKALLYFKIRGNRGRHARSMTGG
jgi:hypothetical protein